jgi:hypothetical protein
VWVTPNGTRLEVTLTVPTFVEKIAWGQLAVNQMQDAGIDALLKIVETSVYGPMIQTGDYIFAGSWLCPSGTFEPYTYLEQYGHSRRYAPIGEMAFGNEGRWQNADYDYWVDVMAVHDQDDPEYMEAYLEAYEIFLDEMPAIPIALSRKVISWDVYYWEGFPNAMNPYVKPFYWCGDGLRIPLQEFVKPTQVDSQVVYFTKDTTEFRPNGKWRTIELEWVGPFESGDSAILPVDDVEFWVGQGYASLTPPLPEPVDITEIVDSLQDLSSAMSQNTETAETVLAEMRALTAQLTNIMYVGVASAVLALIVLVVVLLKK